MAHKFTRKMGPSILSVVRRTEPSYRKVGERGRERRKKHMKNTWHAQKLSSLFNCKHMTIKLVHTGVLNYQQHKDFVCINCVMENENENVT